MKINGVELSELIKQSEANEKEIINSVKYIDSCQDEDGNYITNVKFKKLYPKVIKYQNPFTGDTIFKILQKMDKFCNILP